MDLTTNYTTVRTAAASNSEAINKVVDSLIREYTKAGNGLRSLPTKEEVNQIISEAGLSQQDEAHVTDALKEFRRDIRRQRH